jgi:hypothetical protein
MAPVEPSRQAKAVRELEQFDEALRGAHESVWWRTLVALLQQRRTLLMEELCTRVDMDQRQEDRARGQVSELTFVLVLDERARTLKEAGDNGRRTGTPDS